MKHQFRLQKVLDLYLTDRKLIQRDLALQYQYLKEQEKKLEDLYKQKSASYAVCDNQTISQVSEEFRKLQDIRIEAQKKRVDQAYGQVENVRIRLIEKDRELKMIEKLKNKKSQEFYSEVDRLEQIEMDDRSSIAKIRRDSQNG